VIFDSDVLIWCLRGDAVAGRMVNSAAERATSLVSVIELLHGSRSAEQLRTARDFVRKMDLRILPVNEAISYRALALIEGHALGDGLQLGDSMIAATALEHDDTLATGKVRHFRAIKGLKIKPFRRAGVH
jgi:predicted nucleic acid-binding protein